jgi:hypothetical protein
MQRRSPGGSPHRHVRAGARLGVLGVVLGMVALGLGAAPAAADTGTLNYTCSASILTNQQFTVVVHGTVPEAAAVGETVTLAGLSADVTVNSGATGALYHFLGVRSVTGTAQVDAVVDNAGTPVPQPATPMTIPATDVPSSGSLTVVASGTGPSFVTTTPGTVRFVAGPFTADLLGTTWTGGTQNIPVSCVPDAGQDLTIASVTVA